MNMVLHLIWKDIRHFRWLLVGWAGLIALQLFAGTTDLWINNYLVYKVVSLFSSAFVPLLQTIYLAVFICLLIQDEPQIGTTAFWFTRPISRLELFSAKALFMFLLFLIPSLLAELLLLACHGTALYHVTLAIPEIILERLAVIVPCWILTAITPSFAIFALAGIGAIAFNGIISFVVGLLKLATFMTPDISTISLYQSAGVVVYLLIIIAGTGIIIYQYLTRKTRSSLVFAVILLLSMPAITYSWRWNFLKSKALPVNEKILNLGNISIQADSNIYASDDYKLQLFGNRKQSKSIRCRLKVLGLPPEFFTKVNEIRAIKLKFGDSEISGLVTSLTSPAYDFRKPYDAFAAAEQILGTVLVNRDNFGGLSASLFQINSDEYLKYQFIPGTYSAEAVLSAYRYDKMAELPLKKGARYDKGSEHIVINDVLRETGGCNIILRNVNVSLLFDRNKEVVIPYLPSSEMVYVLVNKKRGEAFLQNRDGIGMILQILGGSSTFSRRLQANMDEIKFTCLEEENFKILPEINEAWLADATLVILKAVKLGEFSKPIHIEDFSMADNFPHRSGNKDKAAVKKDIEKITLPENPTKDQIRAYIRKILSVSDSQDSLDLDDLQISMLAKIGEDNLELLLIEGHTHNEAVRSCYIPEAVKRLARPEHKELILKWLDKYPWLITIVQREGWQNDARAILIKKLKECPDRLPNDWLQAVASFHDPSAYDDMTKFFIKTYDKGSVYQVLKKLPGFNLTNAVQQAWQDSKYGYVSQLCAMIPIAMENGDGDALEMGVRIVAGKISGVDSCYLDTYGCRKAIEKFTDAKGSPADIEKWFNENKGKLMFDSQTKKFVVRHE